MKIRILAVTMLLLLICACPMTVFAETVPTEELIPTEDVFATEEPYYTEVPVDTTAQTDPYYTEPVDTGASDTTPSDYTEPYTGETTTAAATSTAPVETTTQVQTNPPAPTEPDEDSTFSDYVSPQPVYTPADQDFQEKDWQEIKLDLSADPAPGKQSFAAIQNDKTKGNSSIVGFLIAGIALIFISIAGFTFVILYNPYKKKKASAKTGTRYATTSKNSANSRQRNHTENRRPYNPDDYNDGF
ncbi:MAG: hypothetical protein IKK10_00885 [Clostridia bacterium]|nr:hypothetical protein [Clostridia bacterium]